MPFFLRLFGSPRIEAGGEPVRGRAAQRRRIGLLALLATAPGHQLSRDKLIAYLWPDATSEAARKLLSEAIYVLRKELGDRVLRSAGDDLLLDVVALPTDVDQFREAVRASDLVAAVSIYGGPFLDGWFIDDAPEVERLVERERDHLARAYADARQSLARRAESAQRWREAVEHWRALVAHDPLSSAFVLGLARALASARERAAALQAISVHEALLRSELDLALDDEVAAFAETLRREVRATTPPALRAPRLPAGDAPVPAGEDPGTERTTGTGTGSQPRRVRWPIVAAAIAVAALLSLTATARWARGGKEPSPAVQDSTYDVNRMAVLYFDDHSLEQNLGPIANGITEELIHQLAGVNAFQVISRNGVKPFRSRPVSVDSLARALRVGSLVEGSVQQSGTRLRVTVQFIDTRSGTHLDSRTFEQPREELFALEERIGQEIAAALRRRLGRQLHPRQVRAGTRAYRAAELVLTGDAQLDAADSILTRCDTASRRLGIAALERADSLYAQAAAADSRWSLPWIGRGWAVRRRALMEEDDRRPPLYELALEHAADAVRRDSTEPRALELRGTLAWGLVQISPALQRDPRRTGAVGRDLEAAVARDTTLASAWATLSGYYRSRGQFAEAQDAAKQAFAADAYLASAQRVFPQIISSEYVNHHPDSARAYCSRARLLMPENWHFIECELTRMLYEDDRRPDPAGAWSIVRRLQALDEREHFTACGFEYATTYWPMVAATIEARAGNAAVARRVLAEARKAVAGRPDLRVSFEPDEAYLLHVLGAEDSALAIKRRLSTENAILARYFESDPRLKQIGAGVRGTTGTR